MSQGVAEVLIGILQCCFCLWIANNQFERRPELRTRIISLTDGNLIINLLPPETDVAKVRYEMLGDRLLVTDVEDLRLDIDEFRGR